jgi:hypothetical protein
MKPAERFLGWVANVSAKTLVVMGEGDKLTPVALGAQLADALPNGHLYVISESSHQVAPLRKTPFSEWHPQIHTLRPGTGNVSLLLRKYSVVIQKIKKCCAGRTVEVSKSKLCRGVMGHAVAK